jgi:hypothetical protein
MGTGNVGDASPRKAKDDTVPIGRDTRTEISSSVRNLLTVGTVTGTVVEIAWLAAHVASYPFGVVQERVRDEDDRFSLGDLSPVHRGLLISDVAAAGTPILLLHGMVDNRSIFALLRRNLRRRGFGRVTTMNYRIWTSDVRTAAKQLGETVDAICEQTGYERIHVVGHSLGGLIARYYVQRLGGDARVHTLVTLGTPHRGTHAARLVPGGICRQMVPGSDIIAELEEPAPDCQTRFVSFWSDIDALISPKQSARLDHPDLAARNILVRGVGHLSLPIHRRVVHEIVATLAHLDSDGTTVTAGVTRLTSKPEPAGLRARLRPTRRSVNAG